MSEWRKELDPAAASLLRPGTAPTQPALMLATLTDRHFSDPAWFYERKLDGERCLAVRTGGSVRLLSRTAHDLTSTYPEVADALAMQGGGDLAVDGEVVAFEGDRDSFARLQARLGVQRPAPRLLESVPVVHCVFDVLHVDGYDATALPLADRKTILSATVTPGGAIQMVPHRVGDGVGFYQEACAAGWEGLVVKRALAPYSAGRSRDWLKFKCTWGQELVIGGFTDPTGSRTDFGALLVGYHVGNDLVYAGKVGTGFDRQTLGQLGERLRHLEQADSPFAPFRPLSKGTHWVRPEVVAEVGFAEWTGDGRLRHPRYRGLRLDKDPRSVVRERPAG